jgi:hypothetical protein
VKPAQKGHTAADSFYSEIHLFTVLPRDGKKTRFENPDDRAEVLNQLIILSDA